MLLKNSSSCRKSTKRQKERKQCCWRSYFNKLSDRSKSDWLHKSINLFGLNLAHLYTEHYCLLIKWLYKFSTYNKLIEQRNFVFRRLLLFPLHFKALYILFLIVPYWIQTPVLLWNGFMTKKQVIFLYEH